MNNSPASVVEFYSPVRPVCSHTHQSYILAHSPFSPQWIALCRRDWIHLTWRCAGLQPPPPPPPPRARVSGPQAELSGSNRGSLISLMITTAPFQMYPDRRGQRYPSAEASSTGGIPWAAVSISCGAPRFQGIGIYICSTPTISLKF